MENVTLFRIDIRHQRREAVGNHAEPFLAEGKPVFSGKQLLIEEALARIALLNSLESLQREASTKHQDQQNDSESDRCDREIVLDSFCPGLGRDTDRYHQGKLADCLIRVNPLLLIDQALAFVTAA